MQKQTSHDRILGGKGFGSLTTLRTSHFTPLACLVPVVDTRQCTPYGTLVAAQWDFWTLLRRVRFFMVVEWKCKKYAQDWRCIENKRPYVSSCLTLCCRALFANDFLANLFQTKGRPAGNMLSLLTFDDALEPRHVSLFWQQWLLCNSLPDPLREASCAATPKYTRQGLSQARRDPRTCGKSKQQHRALNQSKQKSETPKQTVKRNFRKFRFFGNVISKSCVLRPLNFESSKWN